MKKRGPHQVDEGHTHDDEEEGGGEEEEERLDLIFQAYSYGWIVNDSDFAHTTSASILP